MNDEYSNDSTNNSTNNNSNDSTNNYSMNDNNSSNNSNNYNYNSDSNGYNHNNYNSAYNNGPSKEYNNNELYSKGVGSGYNNPYNQYQYGAENHSYGLDTKQNLDNTNIYRNTVPLITNEVKPKRKRKIVKLLAFTAAAIAFGLIAGIAFEGYYYVTQPSSNEAEFNDDDSIQLTEVAGDKSSGIVPTSNDNNKVVTDVSDIVEKVMPSIVAINSSGTSTAYDFFGRQYDEQVGGSGSGIIIAQNGSQILILTNNHVIEGAETVEIVFSDESTAKAVVKGTEPNADLAVLSVSLDDLKEETSNTIKVATIGSSEEVKPGEMAIAIGNALGYGQSVTVGYISAVDREVTIENQKMTLLQTDAAINPGNSGGALLNTSGQVIGINSVKFASAEVEGMGYAIPITDAMPIINDLMNREIISEADKGFLGIDAATAQDVTEVYAARFNMPIGVYINNVIDGSPAKTAGLSQGDIITGIDGSTIETIEDLINVLGYKKAGQTIDLKIQVKENGTYVEKVLKVTLGERE
jgi:serine protease Do